MNVINEIQRINNLELEKGLTNTSGSWHTKYKDSSWVYAGNLPNNLTEGDVICILSQYGEIDDMHLVRDSDSGKSKGFAFVKYEDARSCVLAVDNLTGSVVLGRTLRIDHVEKYRLPKHVQDKEEEDEKQQQQQANNNSDDEGGSADVAEVGHAYKGQELASSFNIQSGHDLFAPPPPTKSSKNEQHQSTSSNTTGDNNIGMGTGDDDKEERKRRKAMRAQKRKEKEEHRRRKEERKHKNKKKKHESKHKSSHRDR